MSNCDLVAARSLIDLAVSHNAPFPTYKAARVYIAGGQRAAYALLLPRAGRAQQPARGSSSDS
jgi:hypothetical protein